MLWTMDFRSRSVRDETGHNASHDLYSIFKSSGTILASVLSQTQRSHFHVIRLAGDLLKLQNQLIWEGQGHQTA
jgi:hypothetical protein